MKILVETFFAAVNQEAASPSSTPVYRPLRRASLTSPSSIFACLVLGVLLFANVASAIRCYSCPSDVTPAVCAANMTVNVCATGMRYCLEVGEVYTKMPQNNRLYLSCSDSCYPYNHIYPSQGSQRYARCCSTDFCNSANKLSSRVTWSAVIASCLTVIITFFR